MSDRIGDWSIRLPLWWRVLAWTAIIVVTVWSADDLWPRVASAVLMVIAAVLLQLIDRVTSPRLRALTVVVVSVAGLVTVLVAANGLGEVPVFIVVSRFPYAFTHPAGRAFVVADTIAVAAVIGWISQSPAGLGLDALPALVERHPGEVDLTSTGAGATVEPEAGHAIYRVVQESLTNAARYAPGSPVHVSLCWQGQQLRVRVDDDGLPPGRVAVAHQGTGLGLAGMQERLQRLDGSVQAGPRPDGGWRVEATVPAVAAS